MTNTYTWSYPQLDVKPTEDTYADVVYVVHWIMTADNGAGVTAQSYGTCNIALDPAEPFTPYADLTEAEVTSWVEAVLDVPSIQAGLDTTINNIVNPPIVPMAPPWG